MEEEKSLIEGYKKWAGDCPATEPERSHWLAGFGSYVLGWQDRDERLLTQRAADGATTCGECGQTGITGNVCPNCGARKSPRR